MLHWAMSFHNPQKHQNPIMRLNKLSPANEELALKFLSKKRGRAANMGPRNLGDIARGFVPNSKTDKGRELRQLKEKWPEIIGEKISKLCMPDAIKGKTLIVRAIGAATPLLQMRTNEILGLASLACGINFTKLSFVQTKLERPNTKKTSLRDLNAHEAKELDEKLSNISSQRLKNAIRMLNLYIQNMT